MTWNEKTLAARTERAVAAATAAARDLGLTVTDPTVLYDVFSVVVHLEPAPVVARVPVVLPSALQDAAVAMSRQQTELDVAQWLVDQGRPVVAPSPLVPREPVRRDGYSMTFWQYVEQDKTVEPDFLAGTASAARLHAVLAEYPGELPWLSPVTSAVPAGLAELSEETELLTADDLDRLRREWDVLEPVLMTRAGFETAFPGARVQPIHGDAPYYNVIPTVGGATLWSDFEDATLGPVEWDLAMIEPAHAQLYNETAAELGRPAIDERVVGVMNTARMLQVLICLPLLPELPALAEGLKPSIEHWRTMPFAGGLV
ncbi:phosphotransferase family protein [Kribbella sp. CA-293567]|uniref:phosphotransferase family protein n=1 Tax=Kribbella sp. CA-293567 TaxID=3002436 RepID=UPI0022DDC5FB|nr:phosphotransferase [Kribbella sp. CA-293567]WBQ06712.1 phosphotransferase [Kribbella sp. CA-293567]